MTFKHSHLHLPSWLELEGAKFAFPHHPHTVDFDLLSNCQSATHHMHHTLAGRCWLAFLQK